MNQKPKKNVKHVHSCLQHTHDKSAAVKVGQFDVQLLSQSITKCFINSNSVQHSIIKPWRSEVLSFSRWKITAHSVVCLNSLLGDKTAQTLTRKQQFIYKSQSSTQSAKGRPNEETTMFLSAHYLSHRAEETSVVLIPLDPRIRLNAAEMQLSKALLTSSSSSGSGMTQETPSMKLMYSLYGCKTILG